MATPFSVYTGSGDTTLPHALLAPCSGATARKALFGISIISWLLNLFTKQPRKESREHKKFPVKVSGDKVKGVTRDLSPSGVYFETSLRYQVGSMIKMTIDFDGPQRMQLECEGTIVRVEGRGSDKLGVAVRMTNKVLILPAQKTPLPKAGVFP